MSPDSVLDIFRHAVYITLIMVAVLVAPGLVTGLIVAILQAATQVNEASLSFIPKLLVTFLSLAVTGPWLLSMIINYTQTLYMDIPSLIG